MIAGTGPALEGLQALADELGIAGQVRFVGRLERDEVGAAMAGALALAVPSRLEPFGIVILEAWRAGTAVVATDRGGPPEMVTDGRDGVLADPFDAPAFGAALAGLIEHPDRREAIARAGRTRVADYAWPEVAAQYRRIYAEVLAPPEPTDNGVGPVRQGESVR